MRRVLRGRCRAWVLPTAVALAAMLRAVPATPLGPPVTSGTLANGATLLVSEQRNLPLVLVRVVLDAGARRDPAGRSGVANLTAELLTEGTAKRSAEQIKEAIDFIGGSLSVGAEQDYALAALQVLRKDLDSGLELLADVLLHPAFKAEEVARRREAVLAAIRAEEDDPTSVAQKAFQRALYGDTPYGHPVEGTAETVARLARRDVQAFYGQYYGPSGAAVVVVGDISADEARQALDRVFGGWRGTSAPPFAYPPIPEHGAEKVRIERPVTQAAIVLGHLGIARDNPDYEAISVMNYILGGGGFSSRLMEAIRTKAGLAYSVGSAFAAGKSPGPFEIVMQTKNASVHDAIALAREEVAKLRSTPVSDGELQEAQRYLTGSFPLRLDSNAKIADFIAQCWFYDLGFDYADVYIQRVSAVTRDDVQRVAKQYLHPEQFIEVVVTAAESGAPEPPSAPPANRP
ncbi:MAG: M16 family metallopeptidase [Candidatus Binatia bacterium]